MTMPAVEFYRLDPLTGSNNFLSFVETLDHISVQPEKPQFSILYSDLNYFYALNASKGHSYGDSIIRWLEIVLREECNAPTYRIGGDDFAVILTDGPHTEHDELLKRIYIRLNAEGEQLGIPTPPATIALIHFDGKNDFCTNDVMFHLWETIYDVKLNLDRTINVYWSHNLIKSTRETNPQSLGDLGYTREVLRFIANHAIGGIVGMGEALDAAQKNSLLDSISGLPNLRAALLRMDKAINDATTFKLPFSILLTDGDNFRTYNNISYATGDQVIQNTGRVLSENLRPGDFVARWRMGDEFIVILPNTPSEGARVVGERFRSTIREASKAWVHPSSISVGVATYPKHGSHTHELVDAAESALKRAKDEGKDRLILAE
jgi:diguanylate cyclase (GGDEF)-like protein